MFTLIVLQITALTIYMWGMQPERKHDRVSLAISSLIATVIFSLIWWEVGCTIGFILGTVVTAIVSIVTSITIATIKPNWIEGVTDTIDNVM